jgi:hypothetical protein
VQKLTREDFRFAGVTAEQVRGEHERLLALHDLTAVRYAAWVADRTALPFHPAEFATGPAGAAASDTSPLGAHSSGDEAELFASDDFAGAVAARVAAAATSTSDNGSTPPRPARIDRRAPVIQAPRGRKQKPTTETGAAAGAGGPADGTTPSRRGRGRPKTLPRTALESAAGFV